MLDVVLEPWREPLLRHALAEAVLVGIACGALGVWVVLFALAYNAESLAHAMFPGLVGAALLGLPLILGAAGGLALAAAAIALAARRHAPDTAVAVVITSLLGAGALLALSPASPPGLQGLLFGDVLAAQPADLITAAGLTFAVLLGLAVFHHRLLATGFEPSGASVALAVLLAAAVLVGVQALGNLLVVAALIAPAAAARRLTQRAAAMILIAAAIGALAAVTGLYVSYYAHIAAGAAIAGTLVATAATARLR